MKQFAEVTEEINEEPKEEAEADVEPDWEELMKLSQLAQTRTSTQPAEVAITAAARVDAEKRELTPELSPERTSTEYSSRLRARIVRAVDILESKSLSRQTAHMFWSFGILRQFSRAVGDFIAARGRGGRGTLAAAVASAAAARASARTTGGGATILHRAKEEQLPGEGAIVPIAVHVVGDNPNFGRSVLSHNVSFMLQDFERYFEIY